MGYRYGRLDAPLKVSDKFAEICDQLSYDIKQDEINQFNTIKGLETMIARTRRALDLIELPPEKDLSKLPDGDAETYRALCCLWIDLMQIRKICAKCFDCHSKYFALMERIAKTREIWTNDVEKCLRKYE